MVQPGGNAPPFERQRRSSTDRSALPLSRGSANWRGRLRYFCGAWRVLASSSSANAEIATGARLRWRGHRRAGMWQQPSSMQAWRNLMRVQGLAVAGADLVSGKAHG